MKNSISTQDISALQQLFLTIRVKFLWEPRHQGQVEFQYQDWDERQFMRCLVSAQNALQKIKESESEAVESDSVSKAIQSAGFIVASTAKVKNKYCAHDGAFIEVLLRILREFQESFTEVRRSPFIWGVLADFAQKAIRLPDEACHAADVDLAELMFETCNSTYGRQYNHHLARELSQLAKGIEIQRLC